MDKKPGAKLAPDHAAFKDMQGKKLPFVVAGDVYQVRAALRREYPHAWTAIDLLTKDLRDGQPVRLAPVVMTGDSGGGNGFEVAMVKAAKTIKEKARMGRPPLDPGDLRTERIAMRLHADLADEVGKAAREAGTNKSLWVERVLINAINALLLSRGERPVDAIGKYLSDEALERMHMASDATGAAQFASLRDPFSFRPPVLQPAPVADALPRWTPRLR